MHTGIVLHLPYQGPVGAAPIQLAAGPAVDGKGLDADILQALCKFYYYLAVLVPAEACLDGNGLMYGLYHRFGNGHHLVGLAHHSAPGPAGRYFGYRAAEVDVDNIGSVASCKLGGVVGHTGGLHHVLKYVSVNLDAHRSLLGEGVHFGDSLVGVAYKALGGNEFRVNHGRSLLLAQDAERDVRNILHRRQEQGFGAKTQISDGHSVQN